MLSSFGSMFCIKSIVTVKWCVGVVCKNLISEKIPSPDVRYFVCPAYDSLFISIAPVPVPNPISSVSERIARYRSGRQNLYRYQYHVCYSTKFNFLSVKWCRFYPYTLSRTPLSCCYHFHFFGCNGTFSLVVELSR